MIHLINQALQDWIFVYHIITHNIWQCLRNHKALSGCSINIKAVMSLGTFSLVEK